MLNNPSEWTICIQATCQTSGLLMIDGCNVLGNVAIDRLSHDSFTLCQQSNVVMYKLLSDYWAWSVVVLLRHSLEQPFLLSQISVNSLFSLLLF